MKSSIHDCIEWSRETGADGKTSKRLGVVIGIDLAGLTVRVLKRSKTLENDEHPAYVELTELIVTVSNAFFNSIVCILILYDDLFVDKRVKHLPGAVEIFCIEHSPVTEMFSSAFSRFGLSTPPRMTRTFIGFTFDALANGAMESSSALSAHLFGAVPFAEAVKRGLRNAETVGSVYQASTRVHPAFAAKLLRLFKESRNQDQFQYGMRKGVGSTLSMELDRAVKSKRSETVVSITFTGVIDTTVSGSMDREWRFCCASTSVPRTFRAALFVSFIIFRISPSDGMHLPRLGRCAASAGIAAQAPLTFRLEFGTPLHPLRVFPLKCSAILLP
jgi:hypothetical protein